LSGAISEDATRGTTVTRDEPLFPVDGSVATMVLTPGETAVTNPALFTVATAA
jgi:hypothetical protein